MGICCDCVRLTRLVATGLSIGGVAPCVWWARALVTSLCGLTLLKWATEQGGLWFPFPLCLPVLPLNKPVGLEAHGALLCFFAGDSLAAPPAWGAETLEETLRLLRGAPCAWAAAESDAWRTKRLALSTTPTGDNAGPRFPCTVGVKIRPYGPRCAFSLPRSGAAFKCTAQTSW